MKTSDVEPHWCCGNISAVGSRSFSTVVYLMLEVCVRQIMFYFDGVKFFGQIIPSRKLCGWELAQNLNNLCNLYKSVRWEEGEGSKSECRYGYDCHSEV